MTSINTNHHNKKSMVGDSSMESIVYLNDIINILDENQVDFIEYLKLEHSLICNESIELIPLYEEGFIEKLKKAIKQIIDKIIKFIRGIVNKIRSFITKRTRITTGSGEGTESSPIANLFERYMANIIVLTDLIHDATMAPYNVDDIEDFIEEVNDYIENLDDNKDELHNISSSDMSTEEIFDIIEYYKDEFLSRIETVQQKLDTIKNNLTTLEEEKYAKILSTIKTAVSAIGKHVANINNAYMKFLKEVNYKQKS